MVPDSADSSTTWQPGHSGSSGSTGGLKCPASVLLGLSRAVLMPMHIATARATRSRVGVLEKFFIVGVRCQSGACGEGVQFSCERPGQSEPGVGETRCAHLTLTFTVLVVQC